MAAKGRERKSFWRTSKLSVIRTSAVYEREGVNTSFYRKNWHAVAQVRYCSCG